MWLWTFHKILSKLHFYSLFTHQILVILHVFHSHKNNPHLWLRIIGICKKIWKIFIQEKHPCRDKFFCKVKIINSWIFLWFSLKDFLQFCLSRLKASGVVERSQLWVFWVQIFDVEYFIAKWLRKFLFPAFLRQVMKVNYFWALHVRKFWIFRRRIASIPSKRA